MKYRSVNGENIKRRVAEQTGVRFKTKHAGFDTARIALAVALILALSTAGIFAVKPLQISQGVLQWLNPVKIEQPLQEADAPYGTVNGFRISYPFEGKEDPGAILSGFGERWGTLHSGIDIEAPKGTPVLAAAAGTVRVSEFGYGKGYGYYVIIDHEGGFSTLYAHLEMQDTPMVEPGQTVEEGQQIGTVGVTGYSTGPHLHLELRIDDEPVNPEDYWN